MQAQAKPWHTALLIKFDLTLEHELRDGPLSQKLLMSASILGLPTAALKGLTYQQLQQGLATADYQQAQHAVLLPVVQTLTQAYEQSMAQCQQMQNRSHKHMLQCVRVFLAGQLTVLETARLQLAHLVASCPPVR